MAPNTDAPEFRSPQLEDALAAQDVAAVAFALRHGTVVVPRLVTGRGGRAAAREEQVRVFGRENTDKRILLLFSSADAYAAMVPNEKTRLVMLYDAPKLREFIEAHLDVIEQVFFDIAGPHTMAANPEDLLKALRPNPGE
ncbi:SseB family protein [Frondihabitans australicus]|uniref:Type III secretion system (T3SS) SseB-like protein n=1 Tax=Frondihabitans australicus TaxID=386892 RepID=A0A495IIU2_9MICO|nr:SseB family protein [Frondihabitans australicus]RKR75689.1 type III secretion system (T3SS) SseB-like protein [Frondihabitans australicus]